MAADEERTKSCLDCHHLIRREDTTKQTDLYGKPTLMSTCRLLGTIIATTSMTQSDEGARAEEVGAKCRAYNSYEPAEKRQVALTIGVGVPPDPTTKVGMAKTCRACYFYVQGAKMAEHTEGNITMGACSKFGKLIPDLKAAPIAKECKVSERANVTDPQAHFAKLIDSIHFDPMLAKYILPGEMAAAASADQVDTSVDPATYPTDRPVTPAQDAQGIRAWRRLRSGKREIFLPIFKREIFNADEQAKIPATGDDEHPEQYVDHMQLSYTVGALWFHLDETPALHGKAGTGKGHPVDTKVLTPEGWRRVGDLRVGDEIFGKNGQATKITGVFPRGRLHVNKVTMTDGSSVVVDDDHLWQVDDLSRKRMGTNGKRQAGVAAVVATKDLGRLSANGGYRYRIPMVEPVDFPERDLPIHPYVLGVLLANGALGSGEAVYSSNDEDVIEAVGRLVNQEERTPTPTRRHVIKSGVWKKLIQLDLNGRMSRQKFIPEQYLRGSIKQRRQLLAALLDCDGSTNGGHTRYHTTSQHLANGVVELVRSLGGTATIQYSSRDDELCVNISLGDLNPFYTKRKWDARNSSAHRAPVRKIKSIEDAGEAEVRCISVAAEDQLYVTEDYIVTHNTEFFRYMAWLMQLPFERISITRDSEIDDLAGKMHFENNETVFKPGRIPKAWVKPCVVVLDEPNTGPPEVWQYIRPLTDNSKQLVNDKNEGEVIKRHAFAFLGMAMNPAWDARNVGAEMIGDADGSRLMHIFVDMPGELVERGIIRARCDLDGFNLNQDHEDVIMRVAKTLREMSDNGELPLTWGIRNQIKVARATAWFDLPKAYSLGVLDYLEPETREVVLNIVTEEIKAQEKKARQRNVRR